VKTCQYTRLINRAWIPAWKFISILAILSFTVQQENSKGSLVYKGNKKTYNVELKYAHFVTGPDSFDPDKKIRRLIFTSSSLESRIKTCEVMSCVDRYIEGIQVDLDAAHRILYWVNLNDQLVQYSGTAALDAISISSQSDDRIAGRLQIDNAAGGGPVVDVTFDAALIKSFAKHR
jgi:hypothetical protein